MVRHIAATAPILRRDSISAGLEWRKPMYLENFIEIAEILIISSLNVKERKLP